MVVTPYVALGVVQGTRPAHGPRTAIGPGHTGREALKNPGTPVWQSQAQSNLASVLLAFLCA
jgi:hypothetical protein